MRELNSLIDQTYILLLVIELAPEKIEFRPINLEYLIKGLNSPPYFHVFQI